MLHLAKTIVLTEHDVSARRHDIVRRRQELVVKESELATRETELQQLRLDFSAAASGHAKARRSPESTMSAADTKKGPSLARAAATVAQRVLSVLEMEPRALSPAELFNMLELPPPIETLRTTLWKMAQHGLIARPFPGGYCARQYEALVRRPGGEEAG